jgi:hypothetical protein
MAQGRTRNSGRVHGIGLARNTVSPTGFAHHPGRHPHRSFAPSDQVTLEMSGYVATVLDREHPFAVQLPCPFHELLEPRGAGAHRELPEDATGPPVERDGRMGLFVWIDPHDHPGPPSWTHTPDGRTTGGHASVGLKQAPMKSRRQAFADGGRHNAWRSSRLAGDTNGMSQPAVGRRLSRGHPRDLTCVPTLTLRRTVADTRRPVQRVDQPCGVGGINGLTPGGRDQRLAEARVLARAVDDAALVATITPAGSSVPLERRAVALPPEVDYAKAAPGGNRKA